MQTLTIQQTKPGRVVRIEVPDESTIGRAEEVTVVDGEGTRWTGRITEISWVRASVSPITFRKYVKVRLDQTCAVVA